VDSAAREDGVTTTGWLTTFFFAVVCTACASSGPSAGPDESELVSGEEVAAYTNVYTALQELRPSWVRQAREVFVDDQYAGGTELLRGRFDEQIRYVELVPRREVVRRFGPCQAPAGTGVIDTPRDPSCGTRPVIHIVRYAR